MLRWLPWLNVTADHTSDRISGAKLHRGGFPLNIRLFRTLCASSLQSPPESYPKPDTLGEVRVRSLWLWAMTMQYYSSAYDSEGTGPTNSLLSQQGSGFGFELRPHPSVRSTLSGDIRGLAGIDKAPIDQSVSPRCDRKQDERRESKRLDFILVLAALLITLKHVFIGLR